MEGSARAGHRFASIRRQCCRSFPRGVPEQRNDPRLEWLEFLRYGIPAVPLIIEQPRIIALNWPITLFVAPFR